MTPAEMKERGDRRRHLEIQRTNGIGGRSFIYMNPDAPTTMLATDRRTGPADRREGERRQGREEGSHFVDQGWTYFLIPFQGQWTIDLRKSDRRTAAIYRRGERRIAETQRRLSDRADVNEVLARLEGLIAKLVAENERLRRRNAVLLDKPEDLLWHAEDNSWWRWDQTTDSLRRVDDPAPILRLHAALRLKEEASRD